MSLVVEPFALVNVAVGVVHAAPTGAFVVEPLAFVELVVLVVVGSVALF